ncbi:MAG: GIY-YIG nuclease family protein [Bacteroidota bacterium]
MYYVYILRCSDNSYYTGCTNNLEERLQRHNRREIRYTSTRLPVKLETYLSFTNKYKAFNLSSINRSRISLLIFKL